MSHKRLVVLECRQQRGFTLAELVVAVALLALMLLLAGQVFSITVKSTGQATALTTVNQRLRLLEQTLREDLSHVRRETSMLVIAGHPVKAYWTKSGRDADDASKDPTDGYDHIADPDREDDDGNMIAPRADVLMFFTMRKGQSVIYPGMTSHLQQVVYGHANLMEYRADPTSSTGFRSNWDSKTDQFPDVGGDSPPTARPASAWHLSRRAVLVTSAMPPDPGQYNGRNDRPWETSLPFTDLESPNSDGDYPIPSGLVDVVADFDYPRFVLSPAQLPPAPDWQSRDWLPRSILDPTLPAPLSDRIGAYFMAHCASLKVEWTVDDPRIRNGDRVLWFDSANLSSPQEVIQAEIDRVTQQTGDPDDPRAVALGEAKLGFDTDPRFHADDPELKDVSGIFWFSQIARKNDSPIPDPFFPSALRITVDMFDDLSRLDKPIRQVMVIPLEETAR